MKIHTWGTFSVRDHVRARAFVAEVLLFDKLVIPTPPPADPAAAGEAIEVGKWERNEWYPIRQRELLDILGEYDLAIELPWGQEAEKHFRTLMAHADPERIGIERNALARSVLQQVEIAKRHAPKRAPYLATPGVLALYVAGVLKNQVACNIANKAREPGVPVEPVIAYDSYSEFEREQVAEKHITADEAGTIPYALFTWEYFVPTDSEMTDQDLLRTAAKLASNSEFRETRQEFHGCLKEMYTANVDRYAARTQMLKMLAQYQHIMRGSGFRTAALKVSKAVSVITPVLMNPVTAKAAGVQAPDQLTSMLAALLASSTLVGLEWFMPKVELPNSIKPAAFVYEAKRAFEKQ